MPKKKKSLISESQIKRELSKINLELNKLNSKKPEIKPEAKKEMPGKDEQEDENEEQDSGFHESLETGRASRRFTGPILLPSGQESIDNLEDFAALIPSAARDSEEKDVSYAGGKKTYDESNGGGSYSGKSEYLIDSKYAASEDSLSSSKGSGAIVSPFVREDFTRGKLINEMQSAGGMEAKTNWEERSRLEEFARMQTEYQVKQEKEAREKKRRA